jgi:hypothetical protein
MQGCMLITWGGNIPGREAKGLEVFMKALEYFEGLSKEGRIHGHREYLALTGNLSRRGGFMVVDGEIEELQKIHVSDENIRLMAEADSIVENFEVALCMGGNDQTISEATTRYVEALSGLGYM